MDTPKASVAEIIERLGGPTKAAIKLKVSGPSVVLNWRLRNSIPAEHVLPIAGELNIPPEAIRPDVFLPPEQPRE